MSADSWPPFVPSKLDDYPLTPFEFRVLCRVIRRGLCWEGNRATARTTGMSESQVRRAKRVLVAAGLLEHTPRHGQTGLYQLGDPEEWVDADSLALLRDSLLDETASSQDGGVSSQDTVSVLTEHGVSPDRTQGGALTEHGGVSSQDNKGSPKKLIPKKEIQEGGSATVAAPSDNGAGGDWADPPEDVRRQVREALGRRSAS